ncbi:MAG: restriction endonuclease [Alphaproteobacteria bacterium]|nr:restriction endonuclease [Alphaproteobacteria bacterium]
MTNHLYYGDNLEVLRQSIASDSVDLIYLDPPFNSNASYNVLFKGPQGSDSAAQIEAFDDTWHWTDSAEEAYGEVMRSGNGAAAEMLRAMRSFLGENDMMAYLAMMAVRLLELHRVLKPTGSLYLHCDPTASHYLKILLDAVFGPVNYRSEIIWRRSGSHNKISKQYGPIHDTILFYAKSEKAFFQPKTSPHNLVYIDGEFRFNDSRGRYRLNEIMGPERRAGESGAVWNGYDPTPRNRHWAIPDSIKQYLSRKERESGIIGQLDALLEKDLIVLSSSGRPKYKQYPTEGVPYQDVWAFQPGTQGTLYNSAAAIDEDVKWLSNEEEKLGYPTQKPVGLLERILTSSSSPGDIVLDPFCGCGTTVHAAEKLDRQWIGIDVTHLAIGLIEKRLRDAFPKVQFVTHGVPQDIAGARDLANRGRADKNYYFEFEKWALSLINAQPGNLSKKGADRGIDGNIYFGKTDRAVVSVKAGYNVGVSMIRELDSVVKRENAAIGIFLTLTEPTKPMIAEAAAAGQFEMADFAPVPRLQIVTIEEAMQLRDRALKLPMMRGDNFKRAREEKRDRDQGQLEL